LIEEHKLPVFGNMLLMKIFGFKEVKFVRNLGYYAGVLGGSGKIEGHY
jgi:hypothetical protein